MEGADEERRLREIERMKGILAIECPAKKPCGQTRDWELNRSRALRDLHLLENGFKPHWWYDDEEEFWRSPPRKSSWFEDQFE